MSGRVQEFIKQNSQLSMEETGSLFQREFEEWKGSHKQMDDVLLIGIRF